MPKLITLVEDEFIALKNGALHLIAEAEALVAKLTTHGHSAEVNPQSVTASAAALKAHATNPNVLLHVPDLTPKPVALPVVNAPPAPQALPIVGPPIVIPVSVPSPAVAPVGSESVAAAPIAASAASVVA